MPFIRTQLKFRHLYGEQVKKEFWYDNIPICRNAHDGQFVGINSLFIAIACEASGGGSFIILPINKTGRLNGFNPNRVCGHSASVIDLKWNPFDDQVICSASEDSTIKLWKVPENGQCKEDMESLCTLKEHERRVMYVEWHPTASNILASAGYDSQVVIWNVEQEKPFLNIQCHRDQLLSMAWNPEGRLLSTTCKDKQLRIIDPRSGGVVLSTRTHGGPKASKALFVDDHKLVTTGFSCNSEREYGLWDMDRFDFPIQLEQVDASSGVLMPHFDVDCKLLFLAGKGDGNVRFYELADSQLHYLHQYSSSAPQRGITLMPKRGLNMEKCEVNRFYKAHVSTSIIEPISIIAPRRGHYRDELYPPTRAGVASLSAKEWWQGQNLGPVLLNLKDGSLVENFAARTVQAQRQQQDGVPLSLRNIGHLAAKIEKPSLAVAAPVNSKRHSMGSDFVLPVKASLPHAVDSTINSNLASPLNNRPFSSTVELNQQNESTANTDSSPLVQMDLPLTTQHITPAEQSQDCQSVSPVLGKKRFKNLLDAFEPPPELRISSALSRSTRLVQSFREPTRQQRLDKENSSFRFSSNDMSPQEERGREFDRQRMRYIRRPDSYQSESDQLRSVALSLGSTTSSTVESKSSPLPLPVRQKPSWTHSVHPDGLDANSNAYANEAGCCYGFSNEPNRRRSFVCADAPGNLKSKVKSCINSNGHSSVFHTSTPAFVMDVPVVELSQQVGGVRSVEELTTACHKYEKEVKNLREKLQQRDARIDQLEKELRKFEVTLQTDFSSGDTFA